MKRYFDEYRGLRETSGHVEPLRPLDALRARWRADLRWMRERGWAAAAPRRAGSRARRCTTAGGASARRSARAPSGLPGRACSGRCRSRARGGAARDRGAARAAAACAAGPVPLRGDPARSAARAPRRSRSPCPGMADRDSLHVAVVIPPFQRGSGGHNTIFTLIDAARAHGPHLLDLDVRPARASTHEARRRAAAADRRGVHAAARAGLQGLRRLVRRRRGGGHRLGDRLPGAAAAATAAPAPTSSTTTSPSSSPPRPRRCGPRAPTSSACTASRRAAGCATCSRAATASAAAGSGSAWTTRIYRPRPVERRRDTVDLLRPRVHAAPRRAARARLRSRSCTRRRPDTRFVLFGQPEDRRAAGALRAARHRRARAARLGATRRPPSASACRSPTTR